MADARLRELERRARVGDQGALDQLERARGRSAVVPQAPKGRVQRRPMTDDEQRMAEALGECRFGTGTFDKRFARGMHGLARQVPPIISEKEAALLPTMVIRYRRQIPSHVVDLAHRLKLEQVVQEVAVMAATDPPNPQGAGPLFKPREASVSPPE